MATWDSYTQKATPEDNDTLMIKDTAGGANKRTPFSGVWNWIVGKLTSAVVSQLETTNKSIVPAINELNSNSPVTVKISGINTIKIQSIWDSVPTVQQERQTIFIFGLSNGETVYGVVCLFSGEPEASRFDGKGNVGVTLDSQGIVTITLPKLTWDNFVLMSGYPIHLLQS